MRVAYVTVHDARDPEAFNGSGYWIAECLRRKSIEVDLLGPLEDHYRYLVGVKNRFYRRLLKQEYSRYRDTLRVRGFSREVARKVAAGSADLVLSAVSPGSQPIAYLECDRPIVVWTDATFAGASRQNRENMAQLCRESRRDALRNEAAALARASLLLYSSDWAARSAIEHYDVDPSKVQVLPFGPQLEIAHGIDEVEAMIDARPTETCRLLLLGTKWHGKGADIAVEVAELLNQRGLPTRLDVVGSWPPEGTTLPGSVVVHGFLKKTIPHELQALRRLYREAHIFLLPTRADASPHVFAEASAFGVPSVGTDVGGVATVLRDGVNGKLFPLEARPEDYATYILELLGDTSRYRALAASSFLEYESRLNWATIGSRLKELLEGLFDGNRASTAR